MKTQQQKVRVAYASTGGVNADYEREFNILSDMRASAQAEQYRKERGLHHAAKTPYDR